MHKQRLLLAVPLALMAAVSACDCAGNGVSLRCSTAEDCGGGQICLPIRSCAQACSEAASCLAGEVCSAGGGCVPEGGCGDDVDCKTSGQVCSSAGTCGAPCTANSCPVGQTCTNGRCFPNGTPNQPTSCGGELFESIRVQSNFLIVLDRSGSMETAVAGKSKWLSATEAVRAITAKYDDKIRFGLEMFPTGVLTCSAGTVAVPVGDRQAANISAALPLQATGSGTPIATSIVAAGTAPELADTARANFVLLVTDGSENCSGDEDDTAPVEAVKGLRAKNIKTYVVGFGGEVNAENLSKMATEGGTARVGTPEYYQADDSATLLTAMDAVALGAVGCDFKLTKTPPDPNKIFVYVNGQQVARDPARTQGWDFISAGNRVTLFGGTCERVSRDPNSNVSIVYGCPDVTLVEGGGDGGFVVE